jgi:hypothetical protein
LAVLKKVYEEYDSEDDDNDGESRHVAMVVEEPIEERKPMQQRQLKETLKRTDLTKLNREIAEKD